MKISAVSSRVRKAAVSRGVRTGAAVQKYRSKFLRRPLRTLQRQPSCYPSKYRIAPAALATTNVAEIQITAMMIHTDQ